MPKPESFPIDKIYVPVKRKKALKPELVQEIAESILEIGQQAPILVRPDEGRFVLVEGLHRFEACKALGEKTIIGVMVAAEIVHQKTLLSDSAEAERDAESQKKVRLVSPCRVSEFSLSQQIGGFFASLRGDIIFGPLLARQSPAAKIPFLRRTWQSRPLAQTIFDF